MLFASMVPKESALSLKLVNGSRTCSVAGIFATEHAHGRKHSLLEQFRVCSTETSLGLDSNCQRSSNNIGMGHAQSQGLAISAPSRIFHFNLCNMLSWYHNQAQESAGHVQFHGRPRVMRCFRCGFDGTFCRGTVFVGLREDNVTLLGKVSCFSPTKNALKAGDLHCRCT